jgi:flagellar biogenesis protein FliO
VFSGRKRLWIGAILGAKYLPMTRRMGNLIYRLGSLIAVLAIVAAVIWNISAFNQREQVRENFDTQFKSDLPPLFREELLANRRVDGDLSVALARELERSRAARENLRQSITIGGALIIFGVIAYALGWAARSISRKPE